MLTDRQTQILEYLKDCNFNFPSKADRIRSVAMMFGIKKVEAAYDLMMIDENSEEALSGAVKRWKDWDSRAVDNIT